jgi:predicted cobalt transporter CbtA
MCIATAAATALGLGLIVFSGKLGYRVIGADVLMLPYVIGAPELPEIAGKVPSGLAAEFAVASLAAAGAFWLLLGALSRWLYCTIGSVAPDHHQLVAAMTSSSGRTF